MPVLNKKSKGFTLIELLVVIAIIGILAGIVLVSLGGAKDKAKDARAVADMSQVRTVAEIVYASDGDYDNVDCTDTNFATLCADINTQVGANPTLQASGDDYCGYITLNAAVGGSTNYYCIDSTGKAGETTTNPSGTNYCDGTTYVCP